MLYKCVLYRDFVMIRLVNWEGDIDIQKRYKDIYRKEKLKNLRV